MNEYNILKHGRSMIYFKRFLICIWNPTIISNKIGWIVMYQNVVKEYKKSIYINIF